MRTSRVEARMLRYHVVAVSVLVFSSLCAGNGCTLNDPRHNAKARYALVQAYANRVLAEGGYEARTIRSGGCADYDRQVFRRYNPVSGHFEELSDYLKTSSTPGPERFVIAFDRDSREVFLRSELRSYENLEGFEVAMSGSETRPAGGR